MEMETGKLSVWWNLSYLFATYLIMQAMHSSYNNIMWGIFRVKDRPCHMQLYWACLQKKDKPICFDNWNGRAKDILLPTLLYPK